MSCNTPNCVRTANYMIIEEKEVIRYCLPCINKIKLAGRESVSSSA